MLGETKYHVKRACAALLLVAGLLLAACGGGGATAQPTRTPGSSGGPALPGSLVITTSGGALIQHGLKDGVESELVTPGDGAFLLFPSVSPDGARLAYVSQPPPKTGPPYDAGSDLWVADRNGANARALFEHVAANQLVFYPQWLDAWTIVAMITEPLVHNGVTDTRYVLQRVEADTGTRERVLDDVLNFTVTPDHSRIVYARLAASGIGETLHVVNVDGSNDTLLVSSDQNLSPFNTPRFSPDGATLAFAAADQTGARADIRYVGAPPARSTNGLPEDIWIMPLSAGPPRRIADLKEDLPALAWSGDGHIFVVGAQALYDINPESGTIARIGDGSFHAQIAWAPGE